MSERRDKNEAEEPKKNPEEESEQKKKEDGTKPHDALFHDGMSRPQIYEAFFAEHLPEDIKHHVVPGSIKPIDTKMVDRRLRELRTDTNFIAQFRWPDGRQSAGFISLIVEHFTNIPKHVTLRTLRYLFEAWATWLKRNPKADHLPFIYPLICYTGPNKTVTVKSLSELVDAPQFWLLKLFQEPITVVHAADEATALAGESKESLYLRIFYQAFRLPRMAEPDPTELFRLLAQVKEVDRTTFWSDFFQMVAQYIIQTTELQVAYLKQEAEYHLGIEAGVNFMSTAQKLIDQGKKEGKKEGEKAGIYKSLVKLLSKKFGDIPEWAYVKLKKASSEMLETWFSASLEKDRIEDVFA